MRRRDLIKFEGSLPLPEGWSFAFLVLQMSEYDPETFRLWIQRQHQSTLRRWLTFWRVITVDQFFGGTLNAMNYNDELQVEVKRRLSEFIRTPEGAADLLEVSIPLLDQIKSELQELGVQKQKLDQSLEEAALHFIYVQRLLERSNEWRREVEEVKGLIKDRLESTDDIGRLSDLLARLIGIETVFESEPQLEKETAT